MKLHIHKEGKAQAEKIVFLHGFMGSGLDFTGLIQCFSAHFQCLAPDLPGHGQSLFKDFSDNEGPGSLTRVASLLLEQLSTAGIRDFTLYGYSMGGRIAQAMCLQSPERIRRLVLESASFGIRDEVERQHRYFRDRRLLTNIETETEFRRFLEKWHRLPLFSTLHHSVLLEDLITSKLNNDVRQLARALNLMSVGNQPWFPPELSRTGVPLTYFYGAQDSKYKTIARDVTADIPDITLKEFAGASHNIHVRFLPEIVSVLQEMLT